MVTNNKIRHTPRQRSTTQGWFIPLTLGSLTPKSRREIIKLEGAREGAKSGELIPRHECLDRSTAWRVRNPLAFPIARTVVRSRAGTLKLDLYMRAAPTLESKLSAQPILIGVNGFEWSRKSV